MSAIDRLLVTIDALIGVVFENLKTQFHAGILDYERLIRHGFAQAQASRIQLEEPQAVYERHLAAMKGALSSDANAYVAPIKTTCQG